MEPRRALPVAGAAGPKFRPDQEAGRGATVSTALDSAKDAVVALDEAAKKLQRAWEFIWD